MRKTYFNLLALRVLAKLRHSDGKNATAKYVIYTSRYKILIRILPTFIAMSSVLGDSVYIKCQNTIYCA